MMLMLANGLTAKPVQAQEMPDDYQEVLAYLGKKGDFKAGVLKVSIPRNDLKVTVAGVETPTPFGFGGWLAMTKGEGGFEVMMGDFVLLQEEVNPVMSALLDNGLEVTALHNHFFWEEPRLFYHHMLGARPAIIFLHYWGQGSAEQLAQGFRAALDELGRSK
ncbi:MAG: DUF1259 domain-containing protein [Candidatus Latescibacteria bacterium]|nr:DUF1259 domain-containing protein [Candidatus Latescibacterota bacterium]